MKCPSRKINNIFGKLGQDKTKQDLYQQQKEEHQRKLNEGIKKEKEAMMALI